MTKPASYPFMNIARNSGAPYADVLKVADQLRRYKVAAFISTVDAETFVAIAEATDEQQDIRDGRIDWQTGELKGLSA